MLPRSLRGSVPARSRGTPLRTTAESSSRTAVRRQPSGTVLNSILVHDDVQRKLLTFQIRAHDKSSSEISQSHRCFHGELKGTGLIRVGDRGIAITVGTSPVECHEGCCNSVRGWLTRDKIQRGSDLLVVSSISFASNARIPSVSARLSCLM